MASDCDQFDDKKLDEKRFDDKKFGDKYGPKFGATFAGKQGGYKKGSARKSMSFDTPFSFAVATAIWMQIMNLF